jgi:predicted transcriptional regulator
MRLSQPRHVDKDHQQAVRELLAIHAERRAAVRINDGYLTKLFYDHGIPVVEIAQSYGIPASTVYKILERQPKNCHPAGQDCTSCGEVA